MRHRTQIIQSFEPYLQLAKNADHIVLHFTDLLGSLKGRTTPGDTAETVILNGVGFDGSSIPGGVSIDESDMIMKPDPSTFTVFPRYFYDKSVASFVCNLHKPNGERFGGDTRYICEKTVEKLHACGYEPTAAAELEFYLVHENANGVISSVEDHVADKHRYFDVGPRRDVTESFRMELSDALSCMGIIVERQHHEVGSAQNEITFKYSNPVATSDNVARYKFAAKMVADKKYGWTATFMPKPFVGAAGNGMHVHLGLFTKDYEENLFFDPEGYACISQTGRYFIGGLLEHARTLSAILAPTVNSYKRLVPGYEAPVYMAWSKRNRSALVRVPEYFPGESGEARIEFRSPDPLCNSYLAYAVLFNAGLDGIRKKIEPGDPVEKNLYRLSGAERKELNIRTLPKSLKEALEEWNSNDICIRTLGKENAEKYRLLKMEEWKDYVQNASSDRREVTSWEIERYLLA